MHFRDCLQMNLKMHLNLRLVPRLKMKVFIGLSLVILATVSVILGLKNRKFLHGTFASHN